MLCSFMASPRVAAYLEDKKSTAAEAEAAAEAV
jgi:hypothetical protein